MTETGTEYRYIGRQLDCLADGHQLEPGDFTTLTHEQAIDPHNQRLILEGLLMPLQRAGVDATADAAEFASANGIDLANVTGTGQDGRITKTDVKNHIRDQEEHA